MVDVETGILIRRPRHEVARYAADPGNAPQWYRNIHSTQQLSSGPLGTGTRVAFNARFLGRKLDYVYEVLDYIPGELLHMRTVQGPFPMQTTYTWADGEGGGTRMAIRNTGSPSGFSRPAGLFLEPLMRRENRKDLQRLRSLLEGSPAARG